MVWYTQAQAITWFNIDSDIVGASGLASSDEINNFQNVFVKTFPEGSVVQTKKGLI